MSWEDKFRSSRQPDLKLRIALERLADPQELSEQWRQTYREYLSQRSYSALMWLIRQRNPSRVRKFLTWGIAGREECRRALEQSGTENPEIRLLLMGMDQERPEQAISREEEAARHAWELTGESLAFEIPYLHLFFTDFRLSPAPEHLQTGTDGLSIYLQPRQIIKCFREKRLKDLYLHIMIHVLYGHVVPPGNLPKKLWDLSCDISAWELKRKIFGMSGEEGKEKGLSEALEQLFRPFQDLEKAPAVCDYLKKNPQKQQEAARLLSEVPKDAHDYWYQENLSGRISVSGGEGGQGLSAGDRERIRYIEQIGKKLSEARRDSQKGSLPGPRPSGLAPGSRRELLELRREGQYDFRRYLSRFASVKEEIQTDEDSFDYAWYMQGLARYGNMPLIEPLEYMETGRAEELVIAIDTSGSCSTAVVRRFLEETRDLLTRRENFFRRMNVHIIQCDSMIQQHKIISCIEDWQQYEASLTVEGRGGTDFTPVFSFVEKLRSKGTLKKLKGLLYFTDGEGVYPRTPTDYETIFVFTRKAFLQGEGARAVPDWAVKLCLDIREEG